MVDGVGRVPLLLLGAVGMLICSVVVGLVSLLANSSTASGDVVIVFICLFVVNFAYSWGPCGWIIPSEIYPQNIRGKAVSLTTTINWLANFLIAEITPHLLSGAGVGPTFLMFAGLIVVITIFVFTTVPETKGVSLEHMDTIFHVRTLSQWYMYTMANLRHAGYVFFPCYIEDAVRFDANVGKDIVPVTIQMSPNAAECEEKERY